MNLLVAELDFDEAWMSLQEIIWFGSNQYRVLDVLNTD